MSEQEKSWEGLRTVAKNTVNATSTLLDADNRLTKGQQLLLQRSIEDLKSGIDGTYETVRNNRKARLVEKLQAEMKGGAV